MPLLILLQRLCLLLFIVSLLGLGISYWQRDRLPDPGFYSKAVMQSPNQTPTQHHPFSVQVGSQRYNIKPLYNYVLNGVVVSMHHSDDWLDIYHHQDWGDFINLKDVCVIWGDNIRSAVYQHMSFSNSAWTCWAHWPSAKVRSQFRDTELSNNHLLSDRADIQEAILAARPGDQIHLRGMLVEYANPGNGFKRGTSTSRSDHGNGACETVYVQHFAIVRAANQVWRSLYTLCLWLAPLGAIGFLGLLMLTPVRRGLD